MKKLLLTLLVLLLLGGGIWYSQHQKDLAKLLPQLPELQKTTQKVVREIKKDIAAPPPLRALVQAPTSYLTVAGVIKDTNAQRQQNGDLPALKESPELRDAAQRKLKDMFDGQYFEHVNPQGQGPSYWVEQAGYEYITIGENLAEGNFKDDATLVQAWMDSPGHRANILNTRYKEIGVAVGKGMFGGHMTWLAVQEFGSPLSACPPIDTAIKEQITANQATLDQEQQTLETKRQEFEATEPKRGGEYKQQVDDYNALVNQYNALVEKTKALVSAYNASVNAFNACVAG